MSDIGIGPAGTVPVSNGTSIEWLSPGGPAGAAGGIQSFDLGLADTQNIPWVGVGGGAGNLYLTATTTGSGSAPISSVNIFCTQTGSTAGGISGGIYNQSGVLLACSTITAPIVGPNNLLITFGSGLVLPPSDVVYLGVFSNTNGARIAGSSGKLNGAPGASLGVLAPNTTTLPGGVSTGCPTNISALLSSQTQLRYWAGFSI